MTQEFDAEKHFMHGGIIFDSDIKNYGMCLENPEKECHDSCRKFITRHCNGAVLIRQAGGKIWHSRGWFNLKRDGKTDEV